jgi:GNAT superfamily N-acetyltransferase
MSRKMRIRRATLRDLDILVQQRHCVFESMGLDPLALEHLDCEYKQWTRTRLKSGTLKGWVVENGEGRVVGGGVLWLRPSARPPPTSRVQPYLTSMFTESAYRKRGVATLVLQEAAKWSRTHGYTSILIHTSDMARKFYPHFGFKRTWEMECPLD